MLQSAVEQALSELNKNDKERIDLAKGLKDTNQHGFVDLVRYFLGVNYPPISFLDVEPFLEVPQQ